MLEFRITTFRYEKRQLPRDRIIGIGIIGIALQQYTNQTTSHNLLSSPITTNKSIHNNSQKRKLKSVTSEKTGFRHQLTGTGQSFPSVENQAQQQQRQRKINEITFNYTLKSFREAIIIPDGHGY